MLRRAALGRAGRRCIVPLPASEIPLRWPRPCVRIRFSCCARLAATVPVRFSCCARQGHAPSLSSWPPRGPWRCAAGRVHERPLPSLPRFLLVCCRTNPSTRFPWTCAASAPWQSRCARSSGGGLGGTQAWLPGDVIDSRVLVDLTARRRGLDAANPATQGQLGSAARAFVAARRPYRCTAVPTPPHAACPHAFRCSKELMDGQNQYECEELGKKAGGVGSRGDGGAHVTAASQLRAAHCTRPHAAAAAGATAGAYVCMAVLVHLPLLAHA